MKPCHIVFVVFCALAVSPRWSAAEPTDGKVSPAADASARAHFQRGQRLGASGDYIGAYGEFAAGYALTERPLFLFNMAEAARANGDLAKARAHYLKFIQDDPGNALAVSALERVDEIDRAAAKPAAAGPVKPEPAKPALAVPAKPEPAKPAPAAPAAPAATAPRGAPITVLPSLTTIAAAPTAPAPAPASTPIAVQPNQLTTRSESPETAPVWKRWPFWAVVGGVVVGSVVVYAVSRSGGGCGTSCSELDFR